MRENIDIQKLWKQLLKLRPTFEQLWRVYIECNSLRPQAWREMQKIATFHDYERFITVSHSDDSHRIETGKILLSTGLPLSYDALRSMTGISCLCDRAHPLYLTACETMTLVLILEQDRFFHSQSTADELATRKNLDSSAFFQLLRFPEHRELAWRHLKKTATSQQLIAASEFVEEAGEIILARGNIDSLIYTAIHSVNQEIAMRAFAKILNLGPSFSDFAELSKSRHQEINRLVCAEAKKTQATTEQIYRLMSDYRDYSKTMREVIADRYIAQPDFRPSELARHHQDRALKIARIWPNAQERVWTYEEILDHTYHEEETKREVAKLLLREDHSLISTEWLYQKSWYLPSRFQPIAKRILSTRTDGILKLMRIH